MPSDFIDKIWTFGKKPTPDPMIQLSLDFGLTPHFKLRELIYSVHREIDNTPDKEIISRLTVLCSTFLEPIREHFGAIDVHSGYRCLALNKAIGGAKDSAHTYGVAADFDLVGAGTKLQTVMDWIIVAKFAVPFDQLILESSMTSNWIHIAGLRPKHEKFPRREMLRFRNGVYSTYDSKINYGV